MMNKFRKANMRILLIIFLFCFTLNTTFAKENHPLHIALVSMEYNTKNKNFDVLVKIFIDDFESIIARKYNIQLHAGTKNEHPQFSFYATKYVKEHFGVAFNGSKKYSNDLNFVQKDLNVEAVWLKFSISAPANITKVKMKASVMTDFFEDQTNLIVFKYKNFEEAFKLDNIVVENEFLIE